MKFVVVALLAGCGRLGFDDPVVDAPVQMDAALDAVPPDAPGSDTVFYLPFEDDPSDGRIVDASGHGHDASCIAGFTCPTIVAGKHGQALQFDGATQYALIAHTPALDPTTFTVAMWVYLDDATVDQVAIGRPLGAGSSDSWALVAWALANMMTCLESTAPGDVAQWACAPIVLVENTWIHLAGTWDGTTKAVYINGTRAATFSGGAAIELDPHDLVIGGDQNSGNLAYPWHGRLDELRFYDRALSMPEIQALAAP